MKQKKIHKKLQLHKKTIAVLNNKEMQNENAGFARGRTEDNYCTMSCSCGGGDNCSMQCGQIANYAY